MGRKKKDIDVSEVERLAAEFCTQGEIAANLHISERTIRGRADLKAAYERGQEEARVSLRRAQWQLAKAGNPSMLIWLGKQYLNQIEPAARERLKIEQAKANINPHEIEELTEELERCRAIIRHLLDNLTGEQLLQLENKEEKT